MSAIPAEVFHFSGQSSMEAWTLKDFLREHGWSRYDQWLSQESVLFFQRVRELVEAFPTWQHVASTGRPPIDERTHLIAMMVRQAFDATFRELEALLTLLAGFFRIKKVPDANTLSEKNRSTRFAQLLQRFHQFIVENLRVREAVVATDATGYSAKNRSWNDTDYGLRASEPWVKSHCVVQVPHMLILSSVQTNRGVHESQVFTKAWKKLPVNVQPYRGLADAAYSGEECLQAAFDRGATPLHECEQTPSTRAPHRRATKSS